MYQNIPLKRSMEILSWASLILLVPLAIFGFLSETSLPGQPLYPLKREIENVIVDLNGFNAHALALYKLYLVDRRFSETDTLLSDNAIQINTSQVNDFLSQIRSAEQTISSVTDQNEKTALQQQLMQQITTYRSQLALIQPHSTLSSSSESSLPDASQQSLSNNSDQNTQISDLNNQLEQIQGQLQQNQPSGTNTLTPTPTQNITPTVTMVPTDTPTNTPTMTTFPSPTPTNAPGNNSQQPSPTPPITPPVSPSSTALSCGCYINGFAFIDTNKNGRFDSGESYYQYNWSPMLTFSLSDNQGNLLERTTQNSGKTANINWFAFTKLTPNTTYNISLDTHPKGYMFTTPQVYKVQLGSPCNTDGNQDASCTSNGSITNIDFGLLPNSN